MHAGAAPRSDRVAPAGTVANERAQPEGGVVASVQSKRFSVAIHVLVALALRKQRLSSGELAWSIDTNPSMVRRILGLLGRAGLVTARTGPSGGVELARNPKDINLLEVRQAVELKPSSGVHTPNPECTLGSVLGEPLGQVLREADLASERVLRERTVHSVAEMARRRIAAAGGDDAGSSRSRR